MNKEQEPSAIEPMIIQNEINNNKIKFNSLKGYIFGILFALISCVANFFIKISPLLNGCNHAVIRYVFQLLLMIYFIKKNKLSLFDSNHYNDNNNNNSNKNKLLLLILRGFAGCLAVILGFFSLSYLDLSDLEVLINSSVIFTAVLARFFLKEKFTIFHIFSLVLTLVGVFFIIRPNFIFGMSNNHVNFTKFSNQTIISHLDRNLYESLIG
jgi:drug/metabolite transporter (DMT)-like permease